jgi:hypothetical protein
MTPADRCIGCDKTLAQVGGQRIVFAHGVSVSISDDKVEVNGLPCPLTARARARRQPRAGQRPWLCQRCSNVGLCLHCGNLFPRVPGADVLHDDGTVGHWPLVAGMGLRCEQCQTGTVGLV